MVPNQLDSFLFRPAKANKNGTINDKWKNFEYSRTGYNHDKTKPGYGTHVIGRFPHPPPRTEALKSQSGCRSDRNRLGPKRMSNSGPTPLKSAQKANSLHTFGIQVALLSLFLGLSIGLQDPATESMQPTRLAAKHGPALTPIPIGCARSPLSQSL